LNNIIYIKYIFFISDVISSFHDPFPISGFKNCWIKWKKDFDAPHYPDSEYVVKTFDRLIFLFIFWIRLSKYFLEFLKRTYLLNHKDSWNGPRTFSTKKNELHQTYFLFRLFGTFENFLLRIRIPVYPKFYFIYILYI